MLRRVSVIIASLAWFAGVFAYAGDGTVVQCGLHFQNRGLIDLPPARTVLDPLQTLVRDLLTEARRSSDAALMDFLESWAADRIRNFGYLSGVPRGESAPTTVGELFALLDSRPIELRNVYGNVMIPLSSYLTPAMRARLLARGAPLPEIVAGLRLGAYMHERVLREARQRSLEDVLSGLVSNVEAGLAPLR